MRVRRDFGSQQKDGWRSPTGEIADARLRAVGKVTMTMNTYQGKYAPFKLLPRFSSFWKKS
jgi:hypothetical protein